MAGKNAFRRSSIHTAVNAETAFEACLLVLEQRRTNRGGTKLVLVHIKERSVPCTPSIAMTNSTPARSQLHCKRR